jgi:hypothetical protein
MLRSTNLEEIKAALWEQAYHQCTKGAVRRGAGDDGQMQEGAIAGSLPWVGTPVCCGGGDH